MQVNHIQFVQDDYMITVELDGTRSLISLRSLIRRKVSIPSGYHLRMQHMIDGICTPYGICALVIFVDTISRFNILGSVDTVSLSSFHNLPIIAMINNDYHTIGNISYWNNVLADCNEKFNDYITTIDKPHTYIHKYNNNVNMVSINGGFKILKLPSRYRRLSTHISIYLRMALSFCKNHKDIRYISDDEEIFIHMARNTHIACPRLHVSIYHDNSGYMLVPYIKGTISFWLTRYSISIYVYQSMEELIDSIRKYMVSWFVGIPPNGDVVFI